MQIHTNVYYLMFMCAVLHAIVVPRFWSVHGKCTERISAQYIPVYRPKEGYNYYVSRSIARLRVVEMDFIHDIEKDDFLKELEVAINQFRWLLGRPYFPNQRAWKRKRIGPSLWNNLNIETKHCISISTFISSAKCKFYS